MFLIFLLLLGVGGIIWAAGGIHLPFSFEDKIFKFPYNEKKILTPDPNQKIKLNLMTWNISYGHGMGSAGDLTYEPLTEEKLKKHLDEMVKNILEKDVDILFLQEVDFKSKRSCYLNQLEYLAHQLQMPYAARAWCWDANYVPFPYWPPRKHFGKVFSGGVVFSRFKISRNRVFHYKKPSAKPWWYNLFYLFRYTQTVQVHINPKNSFLVQNSHLEAFDTENRNEQAMVFKKNIEEICTKNSKNPKIFKPLIFFAGDFNANAFDTTNPTVQALEDLGRFQDVVPKAELKKENHARLATFPSNAPSLKLDYIFTHSLVEVSKYEVLQSGECSDHFPVFAEVSVPIKLLESSEHLEV